MRRHLGRLAQARRRAWSHDYSAFGQAKGGVFDKDRIRIGGQGVQLDHLRPGRTQGCDVVAMVLQHQRKIRRAKIDSAQTCHHLGAGLAGNGVAELV